MLIWEKVTNNFIKPQVSCHHFHTLPFAATHGLGSECSWNDCDNSWWYHYLKQQNVILNAFALILLTFTGYEIKDVRNTFRIKKKKTMAQTEVSGEGRYYSWSRGWGNLKSKHMEPGSQDFILTQVIAVFYPLAWVQPHNLIQLLLEKELAHRKWWTKRKGAPAPRTNGSLLQAIKFLEQSRGPFSGDLCCTGHSKKERPPRMLF